MACCAVQGQRGHPSHFEDSQWSAPEPLNTPIYRGPHPHDYEVSKSIPQPMAAFPQPWHHKASSWKLWGWMGSNLVELLGEIRHFSSSERAHHTQLPSSSLYVDTDGPHGRESVSPPNLLHSQVSAFHFSLSHVTLLSTFCFLTSNHLW